MSQHRRGSGKQHLNLPAHQVGDGRCRAPVGDVQQGRAGLQLEILGGQIGCAAIAARAVVELSGAGLGQRYQLFHIAGIDRRMHHQNIGHARHPRHRREAFDGVIRQSRVERRIDSQRANMAHQQGVTVRRCLGRLVGTQAAASAGYVVDDDSLPPGFGQFLSDRTGQDVGAAARGKGHDKANRFAGVNRSRSRRLGGLRMCQRCGQGQGSQQQLGGQLFQGRFRKGLFKQMVRGRIRPVADSPVRLNCKVQLQDFMAVVSTDLITSMAIFWVSVLGRRDECTSASSLMMRGEAMLRRMNEAESSKLLRV